MRCATSCGRFPACPPAARSSSPLSTSWPTRDSWPSWRADAEAAGFDGFFLWDHIIYNAPASAVLDPWICMAAIALATERLITGPLVTPIARRRPHKLAQGDRHARPAGRRPDGLRHRPGLRPPRRAGAVRRGDRAARAGHAAGRRPGQAPGLLVGRVAPGAGAAAADPGLGRGALARTQAGAPRRAPRRPLPDRAAGPGRARDAARRDRRPARRGGPDRRLTTSSSPTRPEPTTAPWEAAGATWCLTRLRRAAEARRRPRGDRGRAERVTQTA